MNASERPKFDPKKARGALGASLFDSLDVESAPDISNASEPQIIDPKTNAAPDQPPLDQTALPMVSSRLSRPLTVSEITDHVAKVLLDHLPRKVRIIGEISNLSKRNHWYFSLKDDKAVLSCVAWASKARKFRFEAKNGIEVVATGSVQFYPTQGKCQLYVDKLEPVGAGAFDLQFRALCAELEQLHYFDPARKKKLPLFPRRIAIITSETGAALQDVLNTLKQRCPAIDVLLVDVRVQGDEAAGEIARALKLIAANYQRYQIDALILTRGGGSIEDLWAFNERIVADALFEFPIPTIAAIGHETDTTIAELVADQRAATPTQAAMTIAPDRGELLVQIDHLQCRLAGQFEHQLRLNAQRLNAAEILLRRPEDWLRAGAEKLDGLIQQVRHRVERQVQRRRNQLDQVAVRLERIRPHRLAAERTARLLSGRIRFEHAVSDKIGIERTRMARETANLRKVLETTRIHREARLRRVEAVLRSVDPRRILQRGYSITRDEKTGRVILSIHDIKEGAMLQSELLDGVVTSGVQSRTSRVEEMKSTNLDQNTTVDLPEHLFD